MKKVFLSTFAFFLVSVNVSAYEGTVGEVVLAPDANVLVTLIGASDTKTYLLGTADAEAKKSQLAAILTAKAGGLTVIAYPGTPIGGVFGWTQIRLK